MPGWDDEAIGYRLATIEITDPLFLSRGENKQQLSLIFTNNKTDQVRGRVLKLTREELLTADKYEPFNYKRIRVLLASGKEAWMYAAVENP
jgi:hypothetical protein